MTAGARQLALLLVIPLVAAAGVGVLHRSGAGSTLSAYDVMLRASHSYDGLAASLGPNTTLYEVEVVHDTIDQHNAEPFALPQDYRKDTWLVFGADGTAMKADSVTTSIDGITYQYSTWDGAQQVYTDGPSGQPKTAEFHPGSLAQWQSTLGAVVHPSPPMRQLPVGAGMLHGQRVYIIDDYASGLDHRTFVDRSSYRPLLEEDLSQLGGLHRGAAQMVVYSEQVTIEVLPGDAAPAAAALPTYGQRPAERDLPPG